MIGSEVRSRYLKLTTTERLRHLINKDAVVTQACAAQVLGVSRARVQQIVAKRGWQLGKTPQKNTLVKWPCLRCGATVKMWTKFRQRERTGLCTSCATGRPRLDYCGHGHEMAKTRMFQKSNGATYCGECNREKYRRIKAAR